MGAPAAPLSTGVVDTVTPQQISTAPHVSACTHNHYSPAGTALSPQTTTQSRPKRPTINGWLEDAQDATTGPMSSLHEEWNVPRGPKKPGRQYVYFFPGFQNLEGPATIMQPVLAWTGSGNINGWYASSRNCCIVGNVYGSDNILITGTTVTGDVSGQGCDPSTGVCSSWTITVTDQRSKKSATLTTTSGGYPMNWTFGGVLEPYGVSRCSHFPGTDLTFSNTSFTNIANEPVSPTWETEIHTPVSPQCGYKVTFPSPDSITLSY
ncbi:hypothetical protein [Leifsonia xyli]|uniref:hypothetical protein n=1 Tax=Leifsonia xyli TaxID=1575 RepID=UPI0011848FD7|nr:hypothetical protein [Leifsonia xyli]